MHTRAGQLFEKHDRYTVSWVLPSHTQHTEASADRRPVPPIRYKNFRTLKFLVFLVLAEAKLFIIRTW